MIERCEVRQWRNAKAGPVIGQDKSAKATGERLDIERVTSRSERSRWKSTQLGNSLAAYSTARPVWSGGKAERPYLSLPAPPRKRNSPYECLAWANHNLSPIDEIKKRVTRRGRKTQTFKKLNCQLIEDKSSMWSLLELFPEEFQINILDVGAALNERPPYQSLVDAGRARIIGFEPNPQECETLNRKYGEPHRFFPYFVGDGCPAIFHETNWVLTGSLYAPNSPLLEKFQNLAELVRPVATHSVSTTRIDDIAEIDDVDFIKIDVQGSELVVFQNALRSLASALLIQTEVEFVELYQGQPMFADVDIFLRGNGFQFHTFNGFGSRAFKPLVINGDINAGFRQALWSDALYVRDWMHLEALDKLKLQKYAVLAHDLLKSFDLAHLVLVALDRKIGGSFAATYLTRLVKGIEAPKS
jgi:FkbM family methyltransferase